MHMRDLKVGAVYRVRRPLPVSESTFPIEAGTSLKFLEKKLLGVESYIWVFETVAPLGASLHPQVHLYVGHEPSKAVLEDLDDYLETEGLDTDAPPSGTGRSRLALSPGALYRVRTGFRAYRSMLAPPPGTLLRYDEPLDILGETTWPFDATRYRFETMDQPPHEVKLYEIDGLEFSGDPAAYLETPHVRVHPEIQAVIENPLDYLEDASALRAAEERR